MSQEHRYDMSQLEKEEATMEAEDVLGAMIDAAVKSELPEWYASEPDFFEFFGELVHEHPGIVRSIYSQMRSKDVPALKPLDESYETWCEERCREAVKQRLRP